MTTFYYMSLVPMNRAKTSDLIKVHVPESAEIRIRSVIVNVSGYAFIRIECDKEITDAYFLTIYEKISPALYYAVLHHRDNEEYQTLELARMAYYTIVGRPDHPKRAKYISMLQVAIRDTLEKIEAEMEA